MSLAPFRRIPGMRSLIRTLAERRVSEKVPEILPALGRDDRILDIGSGNGVLCSLLRQRGHDVVPLDVSNLTFVDSVQPILYDGRRIPFDPRAFDVALLITVLHHTPDPTALLREAGRVARRIVVIEEIYSTPLERRVTYFVDSLFNLEFFGHPHTNRTDAGWRSTFQELGFDLREARYRDSVGGLLKRVTYLLDTSPSAGPR